MPIPPSNSKSQSEVRHNQLVVRIDISRWETSRVQYTRPPAVPYYNEIYHVLDRTVMIRPSPLRLSLCLKKVFVIERSFARQNSKRRKPFSLQPGRPNFPSTVGHLPKSSPILAFQSPISINKSDLSTLS